MGYMPSVDICFTESEDLFVRDTYVFKSVVSKGLYNEGGEGIDEEEKKEVIETTEVSIEKEIFKIKAYGDYSKEAMMPESVD